MAIDPIINLKPVNPTQEEFAAFQKHGLHPYDRAPNDYLRFVAKVFTAWRDPDDKILNFDPFDSTYSASTGVPDLLQATSDKSVLAYIDGFQTEYNFSRLTTDADSTDLTGVDNIIPPTPPTGALTELISETGEVIAIDNAKYGEYNKFSIKAGIAFIDNQLIQITKDTEWWFRIPDVTDDVNVTGGEPTFELGQFIEDPAKVYSLLPNKNYKVILSYEFIKQNNINHARLRFVTDDIAVDEPYLLIATFSTDKYGMVHQTQPINERSIERYKYYIIKERIHPASGETENLYYLRDINPQYLDKKYMVNHKNLFKHLQSQLLTILSDGQISNVFHARTIDQNIEEIDPSVSSGDFVYFNALENRWYPAEVSRQDFDKVHGLYLKNLTEGTDFLFTSGIIEIDSRYQIMDSDNLVLRNLIPGAEYFLAEDTGTSLDTAPFIDAFKIEDFRDSSDYFRISTEVIATADKIDITFKNSPDHVIGNFLITKSFDLDPELGRQRVPQPIVWDLSEAEKALVPVITNSVNLVRTEALSFDIKLYMIQSKVEETNREIIEDFKLNEIDLELSYDHPTLGNSIVQIKDSDLYIKTNNLPDVIYRPLGPIFNLLDAYKTQAPKAYSDLNLLAGDYFQNSGNSFKLATIKSELATIADELNGLLYNISPTNLGLYDTMGLLGSHIGSIDEFIIDLEEAQAILEREHLKARLDFQSTSSAHQTIIAAKRSDFLAIKDIIDYLNSEKFIIEQKKNAVQVKLSEILLTISNLNAAKLATVAATVSTQVIIDRLTLEISDLETIITDLNTSITTLILEISNLSAETTALFQQVIIEQSTSFDYRNGLYNVNSASSTLLNYDDPYMILQRMFNNLQSLHLSRFNQEATEIILKTDKENYETALKIYTDKVLANSITFVQQMLEIQALAILKEKYDNTLAMHQTYVNEITNRTTIKNRLKTPFLEVLDLPKAELFAKITPNTDPFDTWYPANSTEFTIRMDKALPHDVTFEFIYKEDTQDRMLLHVPAGTLSKSASVFIHSFPDTNVDAGIPKWIAYKGPDTVPIFNLNKWNQKLIDNVVTLTGDPAMGGNIALHSIDNLRFGTNPVTSAKPTQTGSNIKSISVLTTLFTRANSILTKLEDRELKKVQLQFDKDLLVLKENEKAYKIEFKNALITQRNAGNLTVNEFDIEIDLNTLKYDKIRSSTDPLDSTDLIGSDISLDTANVLLANINAQLVIDQVTYLQKQNDYQDALDDLKEATDIALGHFINGIAANNQVIEEKKELKAKIIQMFNIYEERTNLTLNIYNNIRSIVSSGLFSGEWIDTDEFLLNQFQYQNAMENQLIEIINDTEKIPDASVRHPDILEYSCGTNGLQYPLDLQPWIFVQTRGKISTRKYPGATSVGIALNHNTLILNIKNNSCGDISEFLNVYGNENDFYDQLMAKYHSQLSADTKLKILMASSNLTSKINELNTKLVKNERTIQRNIRGTDTTFNTNLTDVELSALENLIPPTVQNTDLTFTENEIGVKKKELLLRLVYLKFYGSGIDYNPNEYLLNNTESKSSYFAIPGNPKINTKIDPYNPEFNQSLKAYTQELITTYGTQVTQVTFKELFFNKLSLYKEYDIINYILMLLPEPLIDYNAKFIDTRESYKKIIQKQLLLARYNAKNDPLDPFNDFDNASVKDALIADINSNISNVDNKKIVHDEITKRIIRFNLYRQFFESLRNDIKKAIDFIEFSKANFVKIKNEFANEIIKFDEKFIKYYTKMNKLPNVMWDIFRITNGQRTKWNYTYLVLKIQGMQKELNNVISNNMVQYSPINSELNELKIKRNAALEQNNTSGAHIYDTQILALELKKKGFYSILKNMVDEFNTIQIRYSKMAITPEMEITPSILNNDLYMQDPREYNLSYNFAPYPAYKEI